MCCCIPLRRLSYLGAFLHLCMGLLYYFYLGSVGWSLYNMKEQPQARPRLIMGLFYIGYYALFLPPAFFIFWGVHKQKRHYLVVPSIAFMLIQIYGIGLESYFGYRPNWLPDAIKKFNQSGELNKLRVGFWMDVSVQLTVTLVYLFMLFFYFREIGPDNSPVQSRYAQAYHHEQSLGPHHPGTGPLGGTLGGPGTGVPLHHPNPHHSLHQHHLHHQSHMGLGPQPPVSFRPVNLGPQGPQSSIVPMSLSLASNTGGGGPGSVSGGGRNSTPCPQVPPPIPQFSLATLSNLTYEQQQQLLKLQQHPLIIQHQQEQEQQQQLLHHHQHQQSISDLAQHPLLQQQQYQSYAQHKTPKF